MRQRTVDVLDVLKAARQAFGGGTPAVAARRAAIAAVADSRGVRQETIRAACSRGLRPQVRTMSEFDALITSWLEGGGSGLPEGLSAALPPGEIDAVREILRQE